MGRLIVSKKWALALGGFIAVLPLLALGCGGSGGEKEADQSEGEEELFVDPDAPVVNVDLGDFFVKPAATKVEAGAVTFSVANIGKTLHEFVVLKTDTPADKLAVQASKVDEDTAGESQGEIEEFDAGKTISKTFDLAPGHYVLFCNIEGHYGLGMHKDFTVQ
ncbi:MAG: plastocyanin/azurin family copper-binding protein [Dehalococcoidia bacterium]|nr:plastocyanin/azurin family copper-binding protein [Dehalococcoidia bacterium]